MLYQPSMYSKTARRSPALVGQDTRVDELALDGGEKRFRHGVVPALALATDREHDAVGSGQLRVVTARVLTAAVGVEDRPRAGRRVAKAICSASFDELGAHVIGQRPAHDACGWPGR